MSLKFVSAADREGVQLHGSKIFLSASIPDPDRWSGDFDPLEITDASVAIARTVLSAGGGIVTAAHPTIAPLILFVARELRLSPDANEPPIVIYQSRLFTDVLPEETLDLARGRYAELVWTDAAPGDLPSPGRWDRSLDQMRRDMLSRSDLAAAVFVGGMDGIKTEFEMFRALHPEKPRFALRRAGGAASELPSTDELKFDTAERPRSYQALVRAIIGQVADDL